jgi:hypothetical protein
VDLAAKLLFQNFTILYQGVSDFWGPKATVSCVRP